MKRTRSQTFIRKEEKVWESAGDGVVRQIMGYDGQVMLVKVKFEKGAVGTLHAHYHTQTTYVERVEYSNFPSTAKNKSFLPVTEFISNRMPYMAVLVSKQAS